MRNLTRIIPAQPASDGAGVNMHRIAGSQLNAILDPFLMLDEFNSDDAADYLAGFPEHPHRGFETITYMKAGRMRHRDHMGNEGVISPGDVQWMTAGRGVLHSEMPEQSDGLMHGFQLWLNLPAAEKMTPAAYQEIQAAQVAQLSLSDNTGVKVISGTVEVTGQQLKGPLPPRTTQPVMIDLELRAQEQLALDFNAEGPALVYVYRGNTTEVGARQLGVYSEGQTLNLVAGVTGLGALILSGQPINEPVAQHGPFVMNTREEINAAIDDYRQGRLV